MSLTHYQKTIKAAQVSREMAVKAAASEVAASALAEETLVTAIEAADIVRGVAMEVQQHAHARLAGVVSRCLEMVFDEPYEFKIMFEQKRSRTEARIVFVRDGKEISPLDASGGGVVDVAAFGLRIACLMMARPTKRMLLVFDEPFKFVSAEYRPRIRTMVEQLASEMGVQFIAVTHIDELRTGHVVEVT